jgi:bifunctional non-homologous end joining protein LigD
VPERASLARYRAKRDFARTREPRGTRRAARSELSFVVQRHDARHLHYDFRLEWNGVLKSWAVPKGPSTDPKVRRLAVQVEDHPLEYGRFEGRIPKGEYGAGTVAIWDRGTWHPEENVGSGLAKGRLRFELRGTRLRGRWALARMTGPDQDDRQWLLMSLARGASASTPPAARSRDKGTQVFVVPPALQLATPVGHAPADGDWLTEHKLDGYRLLVHIDGESVRCYSRGGHEWARRLPSLVREFAALRLRDTWFDGELVAIDAQGRPQFQLLQQRLDSGDDRSLLYYVFDVLADGGKDVRTRPLRERRRILAKRLPRREGDRVRLLDAVRGRGGELLRAVCARRLEGLVLKDAAASYEGGRNRHWLKLKCRREEEFLVCGYTRTTGGRPTLTALLLGSRESDGSLRFAGRAGTGFREADLGAFRRRLDRVRRSRSPFKRPVPLRRGETAIWVKPVILVRVRFAGWTDSGLLRQPHFVAERTDVRVAAPRRARSSPASVEGLTHPDRVVFADEGITKAELAAYFDAAQEWLWRELARRPLSIIRVVEHGQPFTQRHPGPGDHAGLAPVRVPGTGEPPYFALDAPAGLRTLAQWGAAELHAWGTRASHVRRADRMTLDLDPDPSLAWRRVADAARLIRALLERIGLESFLKTSGGAGLHVVVPLSGRGADWDHVHEFSKDLARHAARSLPRIFTARAGAAHRRGLLYIDYQRNRFAATTVAAYSPRLRPGAPVSMPIPWSSLDGEDLRRAHFSLRGAAGHLVSRGADPWARYDRLRQSLPRRFPATSARDRHE